MDQCIIQILPPLRVALAPCSAGAHGLRQAQTVCSGTAHSAVQSQALLETFAAASLPTSMQHAAARVWHRQQTQQRQQATPHSPDSPTGRARVEEAEGEGEVGQVCAGSAHNGYAQRVLSLHLLQMLQVEAGRGWGGWDRKTRSLKAWRLRVLECPPAFPG